MGNDSEDGYARYAHANAPANFHSMYYKEGHGTPETVTWTVECKTPEGIAGSDGEVTYKGTTFDGGIKLKHAGIGMTQNIKGK